MIIDASVIAAVVAELQACVPGRIQQIVQPTPESIGMDIYAQGQRLFLLLSAHPQHARIQLVPAKPTRGPGADSPLLLLLRKYVRGGRITSIECPPLERVVTLSITKFPPGRNQSDPEDEDDEPLPEPFYSELVIEILGRSSNIILTRDDGIIMESVRHFVAARSVRPVQPQALYQPPAQQQKRDPRTATAAGILALEGSSIARGLVEAYRGISPQLGREVAMRVLGTPDAAAVNDDQAAQIIHTLHDLLSGSEQRPCLARDDAGDPLAVAPFWLTQYATVEAYPTINQALAQAYMELDQQGNHVQLRDALVQQVAEWTKRAQTRAFQLRTQLEKAADLDLLRWEGEMIYAYLHALQPGQKELLLDNAVISLNPELSGVENAQKRFREYEKAKSAISELPQLLEQAEAQAEYGQEMVALIQLAESFDEIQAFEQELIDQQVLKPSRKKKQAKATARRGPLRIISDDGWTIYVGRSAALNDEVTFRLGRPDDYWLHARQRTGGHVIIRMEGPTVPDRTLEQAAQLAAYYSAARHDGLVEVDIAQRKHVRRIKGGPPGLVRYVAEQTLRVAPKAPTP